MSHSEIRTERAFTLFGLTSWTLAAVEESAPSWSRRLEHGRRPLNMDLKMADSPLQFWASNKTRWKRKDRKVTFYARLCLIQHLRLKCRCLYSITI